MKPYGWEKAGPRHPMGPDRAWKATKALPRRRMRAKARAAGRVATESFAIETTIRLSAERS